MFDKILTQPTFDLQPDFESLPEYKITQHKLWLAEPRPLTETLLYAFNMETGEVETWTDSKPTRVAYRIPLVDLHTRIHFQCQRSWRKKVGCRVFFREWQRASALKARYEWNKSRGPVNAWGNPIPQCACDCGCSAPIFRTKHVIDGEVWCSDCVEGRCWRCVMCGDRFNYIDVWSEEFCSEACEREVSARETESQKWREDRSLGHYGGWR